MEIDLSTIPTNTTFRLFHVIPTYFLQNKIKDIKFNLVVESSL